MLQFIFGSSGSGKTAEAVKIITKLRNEGNTKLMMLVPDQSSFETETLFLDILGPRLSRDVLVFGFTRLSEYVFEKTGKIPVNVIDDGVRKIIMSKALEETQDKLELFSGNNTRKSVLELMVHSLKECRKDNISTDMLNNVAKEIENPTLKQKLRETALVLDAYDVLLTETYIDPLENLNRLRDILDVNPMFEGYTIVIDSFSGFTYQQLGVIESLARQSLNIYVTLNIDIEDRNNDIFATTNRTRKALKRLANNNGIELATVLKLGGYKRSDKPEFSFLEKYILRNKNEVYSDRSENIETFIASDIYREADYVARKIKSLVIEQGYSYSEIAIIARSADKYQGILNTALEKLDIPYNMNAPEDVFTKPIVRFFTSLLDFVLRGFDREALLAMLKTGLSPFSSDEIAEFENYLFVWNIDGSKLKSEFKNNPSGFEKLSENDQETLIHVERVRKDAVEPIIKFSERIKNTGALEISKALYELAETYKVPDAVKELCKSFENSDMVAEADEEVRVYNLVCEALDKLVAALGEKEISLKKYREYLEFLLSDIKYSEIPRYQDQVSVFSADRARVDDARAVFVIGAVEGEFPSVPETAGAFSETERRLLIEKEIPLTDSLEELACHEKYLAYCALTSSSERLFVTSYQSDYSGNTYEPSELISELYHLFPKASHLLSLDINESAELFGMRQAFEYLAQNFRSKAPEVLYLKDFFRSSQDYLPELERLERAVEDRPFNIEKPDSAEKLFGKNINISASQLEKYSLCPFRYFCGYGLRAKERKEAEIDPIQFGNIVHYFLETFLRKNNKSVLNELSDEEIKRAIDDILLEYADESLGGLEGKSSTFFHLFERLKDNIFILIKQLIRQLEFSDFVPADFELQIGDGGEIPAFRVSLGDGRSVSVRGFIDRVDILEKDDEVYVRIVDYKTGNKEFKLYEILYGINMQMLLYLSSVIKNGENYYGKKLIPAGVLYMPSASKTVDGIKNDTEEKVRTEVDKNFRMNGIVLGDPEIVTRMDRLGRFIKLSKKTQEGKYSDSVASGEQFSLIFRHIEDTVRKMGEELLSGKVAARPLKGAIDGCQYCPFDSVCCRERDGSYRFAETLSAKGVYKDLGEED